MFERSAEGKLMRSLSQTHIIRKHVVRCSDGEVRIARHRKTVTHGKTSFVREVCEGVLNTDIFGIENLRTRAIGVRSVESQAKRINHVGIDQERAAHRA